MVQNLGPLSLANRDNGTLLGEDLIVPGFILVFPKPTVTIFSSIVTQRAPFFPPESFPAMRSKDAVTFKGVLGYRPLVFVHDTCSAHPLIETPTSGSKRCSLDAKTVRGRPSRSASWVLFFPKLMSSQFLLKKL